MKRKKWKVSAGALLLGALLYFVWDPALLAALLLPIAAHELGHIAALLAMGLRLNGFRVELKGFCIEYGGCTGAAGHALAAAAGPMAGLWYAWAASWAGNRLDSSWLCLTAGVSLLLTLFNLLPALPLDGGRILAHLSRALLGEKKGALVTELAGVSVGAVLLAAGVLLMLRGRGIALALAAVWLLLYQEDELGLVKEPEIM